MHLITLNLAESASGWWAHTGLRIAVTAAITVVFAALGHVVHGVSRSGAVAGALVCLTLFSSVGPGAFAGLLTVFALTWAATRMGWSRKQRLGTAERREGRTASQVLANTGMAAACAICYSAWHAPLMLMGMTAALAEAAADTVSSECGQALSRQARLITTFERVPAGTDGGISLEGTAAGVFSAILVSTVCLWTGVIPRAWLWMAALAAVLGMIADSFLGALLERRGWLANDSVNFISTVIAAVLGAVLASV